jgi:hypothetical protein
MTDEMIAEELRLTRLVADQGAQIARLTRSLLFNEMVIRELKAQLAKHEKEQKPCEEEP